MCNRKAPARTLTLLLRRCHKACPDRRVGSRRGSSSKPPDGCDDPELGIDDGRLLANEEMPGAMKHQTALLLGRLGRHKAHVSPGDGFANRFRVSRIVLMSFD